MAIGRSRSREGNEEGTSGTVIGRKLVDWVPAELLGAATARLGMLPPARAGGILMGSGIRASQRYTPATSLYLYIAWPRESVRAALVPGTPGSALVSPLARAKLSEIHFPKSPLQRMCDDPSFRKKKKGSHESSFALGVRERSTETSRRCEPFFSYTSTFFLSVRYCTSVRQSVSDRDSRVREPYCATQNRGLGSRSISRSPNLVALDSIGCGMDKTSRTRIRFTPIAIRIPGMYAQNVRPVPLTGNRRRAVPAMV